MGRWTIWAGVLCAALMSCEEEALPVGFSCDFEGRCPGDLACDADFTCQLPPPPCTAPSAMCGSRCIDLQSSSSNCGACGRACASNETCTAGTCTPTGNMSCAYCGPGVPCLNGVCDCQGRGELCSEVLCVDLQQANISCGSCFRPCTNGGERCVAGVCVCAAGQRLCGTDCKEILTDPSNCGGCGVVCGASQRCEAGTCVASCAQPQNCLGGRCFDVANDPAHCGSGCAVCPAGGACNAGVCACPAGTITCGNACIDTSRDPLHCGSCTTPCAVGEACASGACVCQPGLTRCGAACTDLADDPQNCGACGNACGAGQLCSRGQCAAACALGVEACTSEGLCRSGLDPNHCGGCTSRCAAGEVCIDDSCQPERPAVSCSSCPCPECNDLLCCLRNGKPTCVDGFRCPP